MTTARDGSVKIWDAASDDAQPTILGNLVLHCENVPAAAFVNNELVITGSWDQKLALWNVKRPHKMILLKSFIGIGV
jgi:WD40 repeat protein